MVLEADCDFLKSCVSRVRPGSLESLTVTTLATSWAKVKVLMPGRPTMLFLQVLMAILSWATTSLVHWSLLQPLNNGMMVSHWLLRAVNSSCMVDLFAIISGTALAKAVTLAAMTMKMVEKRMVKRLENAA